MYTKLYYIICTSFYSFMYVKHFLLLFIPHSQTISIYKENKVGYTVNYREIESIDH